MVHFVWHLMKKRRMSIRLEATRRLISPDASHLAIRLFHVLHGNKYLAGVEYLFIVLCVASSIYCNIHEDEMLKNLFMCVAYIIMGEGVRFWANNRLEAAAILSELIIIAQHVENSSDQDQLSKLMKISNAAQFMFNAYYGSVVVMLVQFLVFPLVKRSLGITIPVLPENDFFFWLLFTVESTFLVVGCVAACGVLTFHLQTTLCMAGLFINISKHFLYIHCDQELNALIKYHIDLLVVSAKFRVLCSHWTFIQSSMMLFALSINTFACIRGTRNPGIIMTIPTCLTFMGVFCFFGESLRTSSQKIGQSVYKSRWERTNGQARRKLSFVICRSQVPAYLDARLIGTLSVHTFAKILRLWYNFVQGLLNVL